MIVEQSPQREQNGVLVADLIPVEKKLRDSLDIQSRVYKLESKIDNQSILFVSARKQYLVGCGSSAKLQAWILYSAEESPIVLNKTFAVDDCDGKMLPHRIIPLEAFEFQGKTYIAARHWYYEGDGGGIYLLSSSGVENIAMWP